MRRHLAISACLFATIFVGAAARSGRIVTSFAAELAERPIPARAADWQPLSPAIAWRKLAHADAGGRQAARWAYAQGRLADDEAPEALAALDSMAGDDPDLRLVPAWRLARGAALTLLGRSDQALASLDVPALATNAEACAWRLRALAGNQAAAPVGTAAQCAAPAIMARPVEDRRPFLLATASLAIRSGRPADATQVLAQLPDTDPAANLWRGRIALQAGQIPEARLRFERTKLKGGPAERAAAQLALIETQRLDPAVQPATLLNGLDRLTLSWRGDTTEQRALTLIAEIADQRQDVGRALRAQATLFSYFPTMPGSGALLTAVQKRLAAILAPGSAMPVARAAGLYWDFRDLAPGGADGALLVSQLADRLAAAGLYARAAALFRYQLDSGVRDATLGPVSVRAATLYLLAGQPALAEKAIHDTDDIAFPVAFRTERHRVEAIALDGLGRTDEARALLEDVPGKGAILAELAWRRGDWAGIVQGNEPTVPRAGLVAATEQTMLLRRAIALAMLRREDDLARLRTRFVGRLPKGAAADAFELLTRPLGAMDPDALAKAMAAVPATSPIGALGDLLPAAAPS